MCACGCFVLLAALGGLLYCYMHQLWLPGAALIAVMAAIAFFGGKYFNWRPKPKR